MELERGLGWWCMAGHPTTATMATLKSSSKSWTATKDGWATHFEGDPNPPLGLAWVSLRLSSHEHSIASLCHFTLRHHQTIHLPFIR